MPEPVPMPLAEPFAGFTGRGVRVAVIDSGVSPRHPHIGTIAGSFAVAADGSVREGEDEALDRLGHGTAVMAAIQEKAPDAACFAIRVFHEALRTRATTLVRAIDWCVDHGMDVVNLSLGTTNSAHRDRFEEAADRARAAGCLLVAAQDANGEHCYPGSLASVIGVGLDWSCPRDDYRFAVENGAPVFYASGYPRPAPGVPPMRNLHGISFAVANMTAFTARACEASGDGLPPGERVRAIGEMLAARR